MGRPDRSSSFTAILAGTDGSERAEESVRRAARLALLTGATLQVVFVIDAGRSHDTGAEQEAQAALGRAGVLASVIGVDAPPKVLAGDPADALVEDAADHGVDLVCVGPDAGVLGGAIRIGRVAAHVLRHAHCSVLIGREAPASFPSRVLCAVDGSDDSLQAVRTAAALADQTGAELRLLHVIAGSARDERTWSLDPDEPNPSELEKAVEAATASGTRPIRELAIGRPESAIIEAAERGEADLVVVGHRGLSGLSRTLLGSVSEYVASHAPCPVLVVRPRAASV